jgi:hypothetical protein
MLLRVPIMRVKGTNNADEGVPDAVLGAYMVHPSARQPCGPTVPAALDRGTSAHSAPAGGPAPHQGVGRVVRAPRISHRMRFGGLFLERWLLLAIGVGVGWPHRGGDGTGRDARRCNKGERADGRGHDQRRQRFASDPRRRHPTDQVLGWVLGVLTPGHFRPPIPNRPGMWVGRYRLG